MIENTWRTYDPSILIGATLSAVSVFKKDARLDSNDGILFELSSGEKYMMTHYQDCCEDVELTDIIGELDDLVGSPLIIAEKVESINSDDEKDRRERWTFYKFATVKGYVTIRWYGSSNGYYSEEADIYEWKEAQK